MAAAFIADLIDRRDVHKLAGLAAAVLSFALVHVCGFVMHACIFLFSFEVFDYSFRANMNALFRTWRPLHRRRRC